MSEENIIVNSEEEKTQEQVNSEETTVEEAKPEEAKAEEAKAEEAKAEATTVEEAKAEEPKAEETKTAHRLPLWLIVAVLIVSVVLIDILAFVLPKSGFGYEYELVSDSIVAAGESVSLNLVSYKNVNGEKVYQEFPEAVSVEWQSSNDCIAKVSSENCNTAAVTGKEEGICIVTATVGRKTLNCQVRVIIPAEELILSAHRIALDIEDSYSFKYKAMPEGAVLATKPVFTSDNENVVVIDNEGRLTLVSPGYAHITAEADGLKCTSTVVVFAKLKGIELKENEISLTGTDDYRQLEVVYIPEYTTDKKEPVFTSENSDIAIVDENGKVTIAAPGDTSIVASLGDYSAICNVHTSLPMTGIAAYQKNLTIALGSTYKMGVSYFPEKTEDDKTTTFISSDTSIFTVNSLGLIEAKGIGNAVLTVSCNGFSDTSTIRVNIPVAAVNISQSALNLQTGEQSGLAAQVLPENTTESKIVNWTSSNSKVAIVENGVVKGVSAGQATITASCGGVSSSCLVTVSAPAPVPVAPVYTGGGRVVVLDPGHDGVHTGATYYGVSEQDASMIVALACKSYLESNYGVTVYLTRSSLNPLAPTQESCLESRCQFAQNVGATIMVSLHFNASPGHNASGAQVLVSSQANVGAASSALGSCILNQLCGLGLRNNGLMRRLSATKKNADGSAMDYYAIVRHCANRGIPAVIVEHCYIDVDTGFTTNPAMLNQLGISDAIGIAQYLGL